MTNPPRVSVLIRTLWRESLVATLKSVAAQTHPHLEIVLVGPRAGQLPDLTTYCKSPVSLVLTEHTSPRSQAANLALDCATGEYCIFLDDDDWWDPEHISNLVESLQEVEHSPESIHIDSAKSFWVAHSLTQFVKFDLSEVHTQPFIQGGALDPIRLLAGNSLAIHTVLFPRALVHSKGCRFDETFDLFEDWDFWIQISQWSNFQLVPKATAFYQIHDSSGVHDLKPFANSAALSIYRKWIPKLGNAALAQLMNLVWRHADLENEKHQLLHERVDLLDQIKALEQEKTQLTLALVHADHTREILQEVLQSHSWRITAPLRNLIRWLKGTTQFPQDVDLVRKKTDRSSYFWLPEWIKLPLRKQLHRIFLVKSWLSKILNPKGFGEHHKNQPAFVQRPLLKNLKESISQHRFALLCTYVPNGILSQATLHHLNALNKAGLSVVLCAATEDRQLVSELGLENASAILVRQNAGFDFASWAATLTAMPELFNAQSLVFVNDSVLGPMGDFGKLIQKIHDSESDFIALTDSYQIKYHTQSFFFALKRKALLHPKLQSFWNNLQSLKHKDDVILHYELGMLDLIKSSGLSFEVMFPLTAVIANLGAGHSMKKLSQINPTHHLWLELIEQGFPFIKSQLLFENPYQLDINNWPSLINAHDPSHNLVSVITAHLEFLTRARNSST